MPSKYLELIKDYPALGPKGDASHGEIELITNLKDIKQIENRTKRKVGIIAQDEYWIWLNDAVKFPDGHQSVYGRMLWKSGLIGTPAVAVLTMTNDNKVVLNCNFRHATRSWELETQRGVCHEGEKPVETAMRELEEETGILTDSMIFLGDAAMDTGMTSSVLPVYLARVNKWGTVNKESSEAIVSTPTFSIDEIKSALAAGYVYLPINQSNVKVFVRDPLITFALFQANIKKLL
ncbi:MAG: NUDIX hydrolase [Parachlamydiales bacterium]|nr:NUDIX hydrolase [Parachlamydiales bacterium]